MIEWKVYIPFIFLILASLACAYEENLGTLPAASGADCSPMSFTLRGETDHHWEADVTPNVQYEVIVTMTDPDPELLISQRAILIMDADTLIVRELIFSSDIATVTFTAPESGHVKI